MERPDKQAPYLLFMLAVGILALGLLAAQTSASWDQETLTILEYADAAICVLFLLDFLVTLARSQDKRRYLLTWGWLDLVSSIPAIDVLRWGRAARVLRILRVLRAVRSAKILAEFILRKRAQSGLLAALLLAIVLVTFCSIAILEVERDNANIRGADDAVWWAIVTITTVGYGDKYPVTPEGRAIAVVLMIAGIGVFATVSGFVASWFLAPEEEKLENQLAALRTEIRALHDSLEQKANGAVAGDASLARSSTQLHDERTAQSKPPLP